VSLPGRTRLGEPSRANPVVPVHLWRSPAGAAAEVLVIAHVGIYADVHRHAVSALPNETGGFLLGRACFDAREGVWVAEIDQAVPVEPLTQNPVHFTFSWRDVDRVRGLREEQGKALLGWYHTHPDVGVFLSETDLEKTHRVLFAEPFQIALVYDPVRGRAGYFCWEAAQVIDAAPAPWREFEIAEEPDLTRTPLPTRVQEPDPVSPPALGDAPPATRQTPPESETAAEQRLITSFQHAAADGRPGVQSGAGAQDDEQASQPGAPVTAVPSPHHHDGASTVAPRVADAPTSASFKVFALGVVAGLSLVAVTLLAFWFVSAS
jgi:proteasome lid subunit RPN8/RPN11